MDQGKTRWKKESDYCNLAPWVIWHSLMNQSLTNIYLYQYLNGHHYWTESINLSLLDQSRTLSILYTESRCSVHFISFRNIEESLKEWNKQVTIAQSDKNSIKSLFMLTLQFYQGWASKNLPDSMTTWLNTNEQLHLMQKRFAPTKVWKKIFQLFPLKTMEHLSNIFLFFLQHDNIGTQLEQ